MGNRILHYILIGAGAAATAVGAASGMTWLTGLGAAITALAGFSGTTFAPALGQGGSDGPAK